MNVQRLYSGQTLVLGRWTIKEAIQGKPLNHPSHALFVHFPSALLPVAFAFDVISRLDADATFVRAAFYDISVGLLVAIGAIITGLADYVGMIGGSKKRQLGTIHLRAQVVALALFFASFLLRTGDMDATQTAWASLVLAGLGTMTLAVGNYFGGELVYRQGMRVSTDL